MRITFFWTEVTDGGTFRMPADAGPSYNSINLNYNEETCSQGFFSEEQALAALEAYYRQVPHQTGEYMLTKYYDVTRNAVTPPA